MKLFKLILLILLTLSCNDKIDPNELFTCEIGEVIQKGDRMIGLDLLDLTKTNTFDDNIAHAKELGIEFIALHLTWSSIETAKATYRDPFNALELLGKVAKANDMKFSLTIRPIDLTGKTVPTDLEGVKFNDTKMIDRFNNLLDFIFEKVSPDVLLNIQIGNEIDGYDTKDEPDSFWDDYGIFLKSSSKHIHEKYPDLKVGFTGTLYGLIENPIIFTKLAKNIDILGVTYYPIDSKFNVKSPDVVFDDFENLVAKYENSTLFLQEVGYPSSLENKSNQARQAEFFCNLFTAWDQHRDHIKTMNLVRLNDISIEKAKELAAPYGINGKRFQEYLRTLGIRTFDGDGENKKAFEVIGEHLNKRGW